MADMDTEQVSEPDLDS